MKVGFPEIFETLLSERGLKEEDKEDFLNPLYEKLHDPLLLPDMERARDRVLEAIEGGEQIFIFSDYDADGIPGAVVLSDFFQRIGYENISFYIPHRHDEGFGLNTDAVDEAKERGAKLIITIDCGTADVAEVEHANKLGIDVVITDHHEEGAILPQAYAVVNPKRKVSNYPFPEICGSAVAYKLVQAILKKNSFGLKEGIEKWSLDMVGIATLSDMVPLVGENRILARYGLEVLKKTPRPGLQALFSKLNMDQKFITEDDIAFMITPRINAASRMGTPLDAFKLLKSRDQSEAELLASHLEKINNERKGVVASLVKEAKKHIEERVEMREVIVIGNPEWRPSLLGLVANTLVEEYMRPAFVWGRDGDGVIKGSCRSYNGYNLHELMSEVGSEFIEFGGHAGAGGFSLTLEKLQTLEEKLSQALGKIECGEAQEEKQGLNLSLRDVSEGLWQTVAQFAPFGTGNEKPVFKINCEIKDVKKFGKEQNHLEIKLPNDVKAIAFFSSPESFNPTLTPGLSINLLAHLEKSYFRNRPELRLRIVDIMGA